MGDAAFAPALPRPALHCQEAGSFLRCLPARSVDLVLTDPPYGHGRQEWDHGDSPALDEEWWDALWRCCKPTTPVVVFSQGMFTARVKLAGRFFRYTLIWEKNKSTGFLNASKMPLRAHEDICVFYRRLPTYNPQMDEGRSPQKWCRRTGTGDNYDDTRGGENLRAGATDRYPRSVLPFPVVNNDDAERIHPNQKPLALLRYLIRTYSNEGDLVIDPFAGSASTLIAAMSEGRRSSGCDTSAEYVQAARRRIDRAVAAGAQTSIQYPP